MSPFVPSVVALLAATAPAAAAAAERCPAGDFAAFAARFADDIAIQRRHTVIPLTHDHIDPDASPEPATVTRTLDARTLHFPVMPDRRTRAKEGLVTSVKVLPGGDRELKLAKADSGYQIRYRFRRVDDCWRLVRRSDDSL